MDFVIVPHACLIISKENMAEYDNDSDEVSSFGDLFKKTIYVGSYARTECYSYISLFN
jgi:hypothetical protein